MAGAAALTTTTTTVATSEPVAWVRVASTSRPGKWFWRRGERSQWKRPPARELVTSCRNAAASSSFGSALVPPEIVDALFVVLDASSGARLAACSASLFLAGSTDHVWRPRLTPAAAARLPGGPEHHAALREFGANVESRLGRWMRVDRAGRAAYRDKVVRELVGGDVDPLALDLVGWDLIDRRCLLVVGGPTRSYIAHCLQHHPEAMATFSPDQLHALRDLGPCGLALPDLLEPPVPSPAAIHFALRHRAVLRGRTNVRIALRGLPDSVRRAIASSSDKMQAYLGMSDTSRLDYHAKCATRARLRKLSLAIDRRFPSPALAERLVRDTDLLFPIKRPPSPPSSRRRRLL